MTAYTVLALLTSRPRREDDVAAELRGVVAASRAEPENLAYDAYRIVGTPGFAVLERWTSADAFDEHLARPHMVAFLARSDELLELTPEALVLEQLDV